MGTDSAIANFMYVSFVKSALTDADIPVINQFIISSNLFYSSRLSLSLSL